MKRVILCADDYGQNSAISQAIIELFKGKRLSATSCYVTSAGWATHGAWLKPFYGSVDIGLHFNLTEGKPQSKELSTLFSLKDLIIKAHLRKIDKPAITAELHAQLDQFIEQVGTLPDFIDGHQHVHQLPVIRDIVLTVYEERLREKNTYIRSTGNWRSLFRFGAPSYFKQLIIQLCGALPFRRQLIKKQIRHNSSFSGIYDFANSIHYAQLFPRFLDELQDEGMIMCHPGLLSSDPLDPINTSRQNEYQYFASDAFLQLCQDKKIQLVRYAGLSIKK